MEVSVDWLVGRSANPQVGEVERKRIAITMFRLVMQILLDIDTAQANATDPIVVNGKVGIRPFEDYAIKMMLHFLGEAKLFSELDLGGLRIVDELLEELGR